MKKRVTCFLVLCLFILSNTAFATNWVYIGRSYMLGASNVYVDPDTVLRNGNNVIFWELLILDNTDSDGTKKWLYKKEAITSSPRQYRLLECYAYDANGQETYRDLNDTVGYFPVDNTGTDQELTNRIIDFALQHAK